MQGNEDPGDDSDDSVTNNESGPSCVQDIENDKNRPGTNISARAFGFGSNQTRAFFKPKKSKKKTVS